MVPVKLIDRSAFPCSNLRCYVVVRTSQRSRPFKRKQAPYRWRAPRMKNNYATVVCYIDNVMLHDINMENEALWDDVSDEELLKADLYAATGTPISRM